MSKPLYWIRGEIKTPPLSMEVRRELGFLLRELQEGVLLEMPHSRTMPGIGRGCHELRASGRCGEWRLIYQIRREAILVLDLFQKKTRETPCEVIQKCRIRIQNYETT